MNSLIRSTVRYIWPNRIPEEVMDYHGAAGMEELLLAAGCQVHHLTIDLMSCCGCRFRHPLSLVFTRLTSNRNYSLYWTSISRAYAEIALFVTVYLFQNVNPHDRPPVSIKTIHQVVIFAASTFKYLRGLTQNDIAALEKEMTHTLLHFEDNYPNSSDEHLSRIFSALPITPTIQQATELKLQTNLVRIYHHLKAVEFAERYQTLSGTN
jgi:hypothetical protein